MMVHHDLTSLIPSVVELAEAAGERLAEEFVKPDGPCGSAGAVEAEIEAEFRERLLNLLPACWLGARIGKDIGPGGPWCWVVDSHNGSEAFLAGHRGSAISIALLHDGIPVLGVVHAPLSPDRGQDTIAWAEGLNQLLRNDTPILREPADRGISSGSIVFASEVASIWPIGHARALAPARFVALPSIAYRLARAAAGDGIAAISLEAEHICGIAAGHALLRGCGGKLLDESAREMSYGMNAHGTVARCFGGAPLAVGVLAARDWRGVQEGNRLNTRVALKWPRPRDGRGLDRAIGCLLGQVIGDALGSQVEFQSPQTIRRRYPDGVRNLADGGTWNTIAGQPTDDSELALDLARTLATEPTWSSEAVATAYAGWYSSQPFDIGGTTKQALAAAHLAVGAKADAARSSANQASQANGALMRCSPIGIWAEHMEEAAAAAREDAALTHPHPVCQAASAAFAAAICIGVMGGNREVMLREAAAAISKSGDNAASVQDALDRAHRGEKPVSFVENQGWVLTAFQNAFRHLAVGNTLEDALIETVGEGGDTDTNAAICGALIGAAEGAAQIPIRWTMAILGCRPHSALGAQHPRPERYWPDDILLVAEALITMRVFKGEPDRSTRKRGIINLGYLSPNDPRYRKRRGWNLLLERNLTPHLIKRSLAESRTLPGAPGTNDKEDNEP